MKVLVTGFEPFGGDTENASGAAVQALRPSADLVTALLPVEYGASGDLLLELAGDHRPDAVLCVGEAGLRTKVCVETVAHNLDDARIPDNAGAQPRATAINSLAPATLRTSVDAEAVRDAVASTGVPAELSTDAGRFVCNHIFFRALDELEVPVIFVHVPAVRTQGPASVGAETDPVPGSRPRPEELPSATALVRALEAAVAALAS